MTKLTMKDYVVVEGKQDRHWMRDWGTASELKNYQTMPLVLAVDPSWLTGWSLIIAQPSRFIIRAFGVVDVRKKTKEDLYPTTIEKIRRVGKVIDEIIDVYGPRWLAIETPILGRDHPASKAIIGQSRLIQHIIDVSPALYYMGKSEIHQATAKSAVLIPGDQKRGTDVKEMVVGRVSQITGLQLDFGLTKGEERKYRQAVSDSIAVGMAFFNRVGN